MRVRVLSSAFCFAVALSLTAEAQLGPPTPGMRDLSRRASSEGESSLITGVCYGIDGVPMSGVTVELRDTSTNAVLASTTTHSNGLFELYDMPSGNFSVVARAPGEEARETVPAGRIVSRIDLRMTRTAVNPAGGESAISVLRLKVPQKARDRYNKAAQAFTKGKLDQADKAVNQSLAICPDNPEAITLHGLIAWRSNDVAGAVEDLQKSINLDPSYDPAYTALSSILNSQGKYDDAARVTERAVAVNPNAWQGYFEMAKAMLGKGMYRKALQIAEKAETLAPTGIAGIHLLKAYALVPLKLYKEAGTELQAFLSHAPRGQDTSGVKVLLAKVQAAEATTATNPSAAPGFAFANH